MNKLILISALLFSFNGWAEEQGRMRCEIKSKGLEIIEDGKPKSYSGHEGDGKVGDILHFIYEINDSKALVIRLKDPQIKSSFFLETFGLPDLKKKNSRPAFVYQDNYGRGTFGKDFIGIDTLLGVLRMRRYYKSDWQGIFTRNQIASEGIYYFTLDCRHSIDLIDEVYETISELHDQKFPPKKLE